MATATFTPFHCFAADKHNGIHNLSSDSLKIYLTATSPNVATHALKADLSESLSTGGGYTAGGVAVTVTSSSQSSGTYKLIAADPAYWTGSGAGFGPFRYAVLYNDTATNKNLIGYWDYGSSITLVASGETFVIDLDQTNGILQST